MCCSVLSIPRMKWLVRALRFASLFYFCALLLIHGTALQYLYTEIDSKHVTSLPKCLFCGFLIPTTLLCLIVVAVAAATIDTTTTER
jgi:hypothetical protein